MVDDEPLWSELREISTRGFDEVVDLGVGRLRICSSGDRSPLRYFYELTRGEADWFVGFIAEEDLTAELLGLVRSRADRSFRGKRLQSGFYLTHHFGPSAYLLHRSDRECYFIGGSRDKILWSFFVKLLLTREASRLGGLHLKAGSFVWNDMTFLTVGRGGSGKSVLIAGACEYGGSLVSNTHSVLLRSRIFGIPSSLRLRPSPLLAEVLDRHETAEHYEDAEVVVDPRNLGWARKEHCVDASHILITDYSGGDTRSVSHVKPSSCYSFMEQFALPVNTYGMKYDLWSMEGDDFERFCVEYESQKRLLAELCAAVPATRVDWKINRLDEVPELLCQVSSLNEPTCNR